MKKVLVTGAAGFMGSHVADECVKLGFHTFGIDDLSGGFLSNVSNDVVFYEKSLLDSDFLKVFWKENGPFDYVYHLAAYAAEGLSHFIRRYNYQNNVIASVNLINEAVKNHVECFVYTSSIAVYGANQTPMSESQQPLPEDPYGIAKYAVELDIAAAHRFFNLPYVIFRPHNVFGERQNIADKYRNVIGIFMNQILQGQPMSIFGDGLQTRAFTHISDVAPYIAQSPLLQSSYNQVFNIGSDKVHTVLELATRVAQSMGVEANFTHLEPRNEVLHAFSNHEKFQNVFGTHQNLTLEQGLEKMASWVKTLGPTTTTPFSEIEIERFLPKSWKI